MKVLLIVAGLSSALGRCQNDCSGKGVCNAKSACDCVRGYFGVDCSQRVCAHNRAFVDSPRGDVNGDGTLGVDLVVMKGTESTPNTEQYSFEYASARPAYQSARGWDEAHFYRECSNKGICNRDTGICDCFPGFEGEGCARLACPDDCSGYGTCKSYEGTAYAGWDKMSTQYCECDAGYSGPGCQNRECPVGFDPVAASNTDTSHFQRIAFRGYDEYTYDPADPSSTTTFSQLPYGQVQFTVTIKDEYGDDWTTTLMTMLYDVISDTQLLGAQTSATKYYVWPRPLNGPATLAEITFEGDIDKRHTNYDPATGGVRRETVGEDAHHHVAQEVKAALEELPNGVAGIVDVFELYTFPRVQHSDGGLAYGGDASDKTVALTGKYTIADGYTNDMDFSFFTEADFRLARCATAASGGDDYDFDVTDNSATPCGPGIVGCGVPLPWVDDDGNENTRNGEHDTPTFLDIADNPAACKHNVAPICNSGCTKVGFSNIYTNTLALEWDQITGLDADLIVDGTTLLDGFSIADSGEDVSTAFSADASSTTDQVQAVVMYAWPHYDNDVAINSRFPLFYDHIGTSLALETAGGADQAASLVQGNLKQKAYLMDTGTTSLTPLGNEIMGLGIYIRFEEQSVSEPIRVDYYYSNQFPVLFEQGLGSRTAPNIFKGTALHPSTEAQVQECCTPCATRDCHSATGGGDGPERVVVVTDMTGDRLWDPNYHGIEKYFIDSTDRNGASVGGLSLHTCAKRGLCDYSSGLCSCFPGYTGDNCGTANAIAY